MNAGGVLNTCKSNGDFFSATFGEQEKVLVADG